MPDLPAAFTDAIRDRYVVDREIGAGGMATVHLAHDVRHNRSVAIKVLKPELAASLGAERFLKEIEIAARPDSRPRPPSASCSTSATR